MKRLVDWWNAYWFPRTSTLNLALVRIISVLAQLFWFPPSLGYQLNLLERSSGFSSPQPFIRAITAIVPREAFFTPTIFTTLFWLTMAAGVSALVGFFTRTSLFLFALGLLFVISHGYSYADVHHPEALFVIFLFLLALAPSGDRLSIDALLRRRTSARTRAEPDTSDLAMWPLKLAHVLLAMTYFSTGISKLLVGGLTWMNGYTLQLYMFGDAIQRNKPVGIWMAQSYALCVALSVATMFFELFFFVSLFWPRMAPLFFLSGILFHIGLYVTSGHPFFQHIMLNALLLLFLNPDSSRAWVAKVEAYLSRWRGREQATQPL